MAACLDYDKHEERNGTNCESAEHRWRAEANIARFDQSVHNPAQAKRCQQRTYPVETRAVFCITALGHAPEEDKQDDCGQGDIDKKDPAPGSKLNQCASQDRTYDRGDGCEA